ncbi:hypothetical protein [Mycobacterium sp. 1274761.0]|uniref:hypothetical protein n=1 Tax=Mycobacterium sp. 1274761.0 TaxID=1834077 RepID=UPI0007FE3BFA|nr:hypothetical protein [Mycobacterium sp. 1274761.0]OBK77242.1 hypothetical protein A5651_04525 [Mycobacterium sp. 1274761.0]
MAEILIPALSPAGHFAPMLNIARGLVDRGDRVTLLSGYVRRARELEAADAQRDGVAEIAALVDEVTGELVAS